MTQLVTTSCDLTQLLMLHTHSRRCTQYTGRNLLHDVPTTSTQHLQAVCVMSTQTHQYQLHKWRLQPTLLVVLPYVCRIFSAHILSKTTLEVLFMILQQSNSTEKHFVSNIKQNTTYYYDHSPGIGAQLHYVVTVALCNRADHYMFALWFLSPIFLFFPRLISAAADWLFTILLHMAWP